MQTVKTVTALGLALAAAVSLAPADALAKKRKPESAPVPPVQLAPIPARPYSPNNAPSTIVVPQLLPNGVFASPDRNISPSQIVWNLRSAYNVAALNCSDPARTEITSNYRAFLRTHARGLSTVNRTVDAEFRKQYGAAFIRSREQYMTQVYNYFALPPTMSGFCNAILVMSREAKTLKPAELTAFSQRSLPNIDIVFDDFYKRYAQYKSELAAWDAQWYDEYVRRYGTQPYGPPKTTSMAIVTPAAAPAR